MTDTNERYRTLENFACKIIFFSDARKNLPLDGYRPHIVIEDDSEKEYLGIVFYDIMITDFNQTGYAMFGCMYDGVNYSKIKIGKSFFIMEGGKKVGKGMIVDFKEKINKTE